MAVEGTYFKSVDWYRTAPLGETWEPYWGFQSIEIFNMPESLEWNGRRIRASVLCEYGSMWEGRTVQKRIELPPIKIVAEGSELVGAIRLGDDGRSASLEYAALTAPEIDWQVYDELAKLWRPVAVVGATFGPVFDGSQCVLPGIEPGMVGAGADALSRVECGRHSVDTNLQGSRPDRWFGRDQAV